MNTKWTYFQVFEKKNRKKCSTENGLTKPIQNKLANFSTNDTLKAMCRLIVLIII